MDSDRFAVHTSHQRRKAISSPSDFDVLNDLIHDQVFELQHIRYLENEGILEIPYSRICWDGPTKQLANLWFYRSWDVGVSKAVVRVRDVKSFEVRDRAELGTYMLSDVRYTAEPQVLVFDCCEPCELRLRVSSVNIEFEELGQIGRAKVSSLFLIEHTSKPIYDVV